MTEEEIVNKQVRLRVKVRLTQLGMSASKLCEQNDVLQQSFSGWISQTERGQANLSTVQKLADILGVSKGWLLGDVPLTDGPLAQGKEVADG